MCTCIHTYAYCQYVGYVYTHMHTCIRTCIHTHTVCMWATCIPTCIHVYVHAYTHILSVCGLRVYPHVDMYTHIHTYTCCQYTRLHAHTHMIYMGETMQLCKICIYACINNIRVTHVCYKLQRTTRTRNLHVCMHVYVFICVCICSCMCDFSRTNTYIHGIVDVVAFWCECKHLCTRHCRCCCFLVRV